MRGSHFRGVDSCPQSTPSSLVGLATNGSPGRAGFCRERLFASRLKEAKGIILVSWLWWDRVKALEQKMAPHSSILAWKIPWTEEPRGLQSMRSQSAGHDWAQACARTHRHTDTHTHTHTYTHTVKERRREVLLVISAPTYVWLWISKVINYWSGSEWNSSRLSIVCVP